jgi:formylglycine-generating enzyme required for sulfatase activity
MGTGISCGLRRGGRGHALLVVCVLIVAWTVFPASAITQPGPSNFGVSALDVFGTTPEVVSVWIDGREVGDSSNQIRGISTGRHAVTLKAVGYADYTANLTFEAGVPAELRNIRLRSTTATLEVKMVEPSVAEILIDGQLQGPTGGVLSGLAPGRRQVVLRAEGYRDQVKEIVLRAERASAISGVRLEALPAQLSVTVNIMGAEVLVDGRRVGRSSGGTDVFEVAPTAETLEVKRDGYVARSERLALQPAGAVAFEVELRRGKGREGSGFCPDGYVLIKPGNFTMGSPPSEDGHYGHFDGDCSDDADSYDEAEHSVTITRSFCMKATEVTQREWESVMGNNPSEFKNCGSNCPVEQVSWDDAVSYANALSRLEGLPECYSASTFVGLDCIGYRLPTEAEWEYSARAGTKRATYGAVGSIAWYEANSGGRTHQVGQKRPNAWGLYDMLGNVAEWTGDWFGAFGGPVFDPLGAPLGDARVSRGGAWYFYKRLARAADRMSDEPERRSSVLGFRLVRTWPSKLDAQAPANAVPAANGAAAGSEHCPKGYVRVASGAFTMGSPVSEIGHQEEEFQHRVTILRAFCMKATEVTQGEWETLMGSNPSAIINCGPNCPVEQVSWDEVVGYANAVSRRDGLPECYAGSSLTSIDCRGYRLPTEAEWEYAARAGSSGVTYGALASVAWYRENSGDRTHVVRRGQPNAWGLYDMLGNVWEWTDDRSDGYSGHMLAPSRAIEASQRVARGGSWNTDGITVRVAYRRVVSTDERSSDIGFRLVQTAH